jgi:Secretion system C-terminal sorting domain/Alpha amylase, catalytic domain
MTLSFFIFVSMKKITISLALMLYAGLMFSQDFMMQGFFWNYPSAIGLKRYGVTLKEKVPEMAAAGFTYLWLPPLSRASNGQASTGYDVYDYYDIGDKPAGATRFGSHKDVNDVVAALKSNGMKAVADVIYNHRSGGQPEKNDAVKGWITNYNAAKVNSGDQPYPSDRFRCYLPLGDTSKNNKATYYIKVRSASQHPNFYGKTYTIRMWTNKIPAALDSINDGWEFEPNNGGNCADTSNQYKIGSRKYAHVDGAGCGIDEFRLKLDTTMYNATGDSLFITLTNSTAVNLGDFSDQYVLGIWNDSLKKDVGNQLVYETNTDFTHLPNGRGPMSWSSFKPNGAPTQLSGDQDAMLFFYDIDQNNAVAKKTLTDYTQWMFDSVGMGGLRIDAVKHFPSSFLSGVLNSLNQHNTNPGMIVGEHYDNAGTINNWTNDVTNGLIQPAKDSLHVRAFDFDLRFGLKDACQKFGKDVREVFTTGLVDGAGGSGMRSVTFINNHDFRDSTNPPTTLNPELAYAYILTNNKIGVPCVFYSDYYGSNFMRGRIKGLMKAHKKYIFGANAIDYLSAKNTSYAQFFVKGFTTTTLIYQIHNPKTSKDVIVAINFAGDSLDVYQKVNTATVAAGDTFTDMYGISKTPTTRITSNNEIHVVIPPRSFTVFVKGNHTDSLISLGDTLSKNVGIAEVNPSETVLVYPNPFSGQITIQRLDAIQLEAQVTLLDMTGRPVYHDVIWAGVDKAVLHTAELSNGVYILKLQTATGSVSKRIIKQ